MSHRQLDLPPWKRGALRTLSLLSPKWHPAVLLTISHTGPAGFNELLDHIPGISSKVLSSTLQALADEDLIERRVITESPLRVEYVLTDAGAELESALEALGEWGHEQYTGENSTVLLAAPARRVTTMYESWLEDRYEVHRIHDVGDLATIEIAEIDTAIIDELLFGRELDASFSKHCRTIALVGDRPSFELLERSCDDVLRKPVVRETLRERVEEQLQRQGEPAQIREQRSLEAKLRTFESIYASRELESEDAYQTVRSHLVETRISGTEQT